MGAQIIDKWLNSKGVFNNYLMSFSSHFRFSLVLADEVTKMYIYIF